MVKNGYVPQLWENPERYEEPNNKPYEREKKWVKVAVEKLKEARLVEETGREDLWCVNPLTVAMNSKGKRRLCLDLSRYMNKIVKAPKFKIDSTLAALQVIEKGDYMFSFDLKSAYHQIRMNKNFTKYLGFAIEEGDGRKRYFMYLSLPIGLNDAMRVLTKLMKSLLERWRSCGMKVFIHVDNGI